MVSLRRSTKADKSFPGVRWYDQKNERQTSDTVNGGLARDFYDLKREQAGRYLYFGDLAN